MHRDLAELGVGTFCAVAVGSPGGPAAARDLVPEELLDGEPLDFQAAAGALATMRTLVLASPELALLEELVRAGFAGDVLVLVPPALDEVRSGSVRANVPNGVRVGFVDGLAPPAGLTPFGTSLVVTGVDAGGGLSLIPSGSAQVLRMWETLWFGRRTLVVPRVVQVRSRPLGWTSVTTRQVFTDVVSAGDRLRSDRSATGATTSAVPDVEAS